MRGRSTCRGIDWLHTLTNSTEMTIINQLDYNPILVLLFCFRFLFLLLTVHLLDDMHLTPIIIRMQLQTKPRYYGDVNKNMNESYYNY